MSLLELAVVDLALLERVRLRLEPGFTVLTGETGAGKSLLIDALALVLGGRGDAGMVRPGATSARVEALFAVADASEGVLIAVREVAAGGRSLARLDDETVTVGRLADTVGPLVEIHGQHDQQRLLSASAQRDLLDAYAGAGNLRRAAADAVAAWRENTSALRDLAIDPAELERRIELRAHAADEIEGAGIHIGEVEGLRARLAAAASGERIVGLLAAARDRLARDGGARDPLAMAARDAAEAARLDPRLAAIADRLAGLTAEVDDTADEVRRASDATEHDPAVVAALEERLGLLYALLRKYGDSEEAVIAEGQRAAAEAERLRALDEERATRTAADARLRVAAETVAAELSAARREAASRLESAVSAALHELGFTRAALEVTVAPAPLDASGAYAVEFRFAPNPGEPAMALARIASGGELSRVALALKSVLAGADGTPTLIFDEIDAGVGGRSAEPIGRMLRRLAADHQVLCITHLPQIAAHADQHLRIAKRERDGRTITDVELLDDETRLVELAAMLGDEAGAGALAAARELRARAAIEGALPGRAA